MKVSDQNSVLGLIVAGLIFLVIAIYAIISTPSYIIQNWAEILSSKKSADISYLEILISPSENWLTYHGDYRATRYSPLRQINRENIKSLDPKWAYNISGSFNLRVTPLVYDGVMYVTNVDEVRAINAVTGQKIWSWKDKKPINDDVRVAYKNDEHPEGLNRGVALLGNKIFFIANDCVIVALNRATGDVIWQKKYADETKGYYATLAPLAIQDRVIVGVSGSDYGTRGFIAAFRAIDGRELWRFWTVTGYGEPLAKTWGENTNFEKGGATSWLTGSYDPESNTIYWPTGAPWPHFDGSTRPGDNLYSNSILAIDAGNGKLKWYFQFTPHDTHEWDATEIPVLVDMDWQGRQRKLLLQANRNGFFYVLDRITGEFLLGKPFVKKLNWAKGLNASGRPILASSQEGYNLKNKEKLCPWLRGATNWWSPAYSPETKLFYLTALEQCGYKNGSEKGDFFLRAIDPQLGEIKWEYPMSGPSNMAAGILATAGGLIFAGDDNGRLIALDAKTGEVLWNFPMARAIFASPMTYTANGQQYIAIAAGSDIFTFSLFK